MALELPELVQRLSLNTSGFSKGVKEAQAGSGTLQGSFLSTIKSAGAVVAPLALIGGAAVKAGLDVEAAVNNIANKTGATGKKLEELKASFEAVGKSTPESFTAISDTIATVSQRFGLAGKPLQTLTSQILELNRITKDSVGVKDLSTAFAGFNIPVSKTSTELDRFFKISQRTQVPVSALIQGVTTGGPQFRAFGLDLDHSANLLGKLSLAGVPANAALLGLKKAMAEAAKESKPAPQFLRDFITQVEALAVSGNKVGAQHLANQLFGARGAGIVDAVVSGKLALKDLDGAVLATGDGILKTAARTKDFPEQFKQFRNQAELSLAPIGEKILPVLSGALKLVSDNAGILVPGIAALGGAFALIKLGSLISNLGELVRTLPELGANLGAGSLALGGLGVALGVGILAYKAWNAQSDEARARAKAFGSAVDGDSGKLGDNTNALIKNSLAHGDNLKNLNKAGVTIAEYTKAVLGNSAAQADVVQKFKDAGVANTELGLTYANSTKAAADHIAVLQQEAAAGDANAKSILQQQYNIQGLVGALQTLPRAPVTVNIAANTQNAITGLQGVIDKINTIRQTPGFGALGIQVQSPTSSVYAPKPKGIGLDGKPYYASGGPFPALQPFIAGERGPELIMPNFPGVVATAQTTREALSGGGGGNVTIAPGAVQITIHGDVDSRQVRKLKTIVDQKLDDVARKVQAGRR